MQLSDVTIIIPSYCTTEQSVGWLVDAVNSAARQGCLVVVVDDGSPLQGEVYNYVWQLATLDKSVQIILSDHKGVSAARNEAVRFANTSLILPLDCDDELVPDAVKQLVAQWNGTPIYPDLEKFTENGSQYYPLLSFDCDLIQQKIGIASVNVLHSVEQHKAIGGWDESLDFYEDGEYNARLMHCYRAIRFPKPLVRYRQHQHQRTRTQAQQDTYAKKVFSMIRRFDMACPGGCGKRRAQQQQAQQVQQAKTATKSFAAAPVLPGEKDGRVLARYVGGAGRGTHYYRGPKTKWAYKVKHNDELYVDKSDVVDDPERVGVSTSLLLQLRPEPVVAKVIEQITVTEPKQKRTPRTDKEKDPIVGHVETKDLPDISNMTQGLALASLSDISPEEAAEVLKREKAHKNRKKVVQRLERRIQAAGDMEDDSDYD